MENNIKEIKQDLRQGLFETKLLMSWIENLDKYHYNDELKDYIKAIKERAENLDKILLNLTFNLIEK